MELVTGHVQDYAWGPVDGLARWTSPAGGPQAELWFGSHPNGPSPLLSANGTAGSQLSILTKILAAARPLSIQIHPSAARAAAMYDRQRRDPLAAHLVSDPYGKAEILIALEPFVILEGFRDPQVSAAVFNHLGEGMRAVAQTLGAGDLPTAITTLLMVSPDQVFAAADRLPLAMRSAGLNDHAVATMEEVAEAFPGDPGVLVAALLHSRTLQPGQAVYVDPGTVHAYVRGLGIEVMTNSDNVLRLGLTAKTIAVDAALDALDLRAQPHPMDPPDVNGVRTYAPDGAPFTVKVVSGSDVVAQSGHARIVVCLSGEMWVDGTVLAAGQGALLEAEDPDLHVRVSGTAVVASHANHDS